MAIDLDVRSSSRNGLDFSLVFQDASLDLVNSDNTIETDLTRVGVTVFDVPANSRIHTGLLLGYAFADHPDQALAQGLEMDGAYLGIAIRTDLVHRDPFKLEFYFHYLYQEVNAAEENEKLSLQWNEFSTSLRANYTLTPSLRIIAAATYGIVDAKQRFRGTTSQTLKLDNDTEVGAMAGLDYLVGRSEYIGFHFNSGMLAGVNIVFQKWF